LDRCGKGTAKKRFHYVTFWSNGNEILNSRMNLGVGYGRVVNYIDIPGSEKKFVEIQDVPSWNHSV
jgi:hypothetical protein